MSEFFVRDPLCLVCVCKPNTRLSLQQIICNRWDTLKFITLQKHQTSHNQRNLIQFITHSLHIMLFIYHIDTD